MSPIAGQLRIEQLAEHPHLIPIIAGWIHSEWWASAAGASVETISSHLQAHLVLDQIPLTLVALSGSRPIGTATLVAHDVGTDEWPHLSPWLAALYVLPGCRQRGVGGALVNAAAAKASALGVGLLHLLTTEREQFYAHLGWQVTDRGDEKVVMSKVAGRSQ